MENDQRLLRRSLCVLVAVLQVFIIIHTASETVGSGTLIIRVNETNSSPHVPGTHTAIRYPSSKGATLPAPTYPSFRTGSLRKASKASSTSLSIPRKSTTASVTTITASVSAPQNSTVVPISATAITRSLRGPDSHEMGEATATSYDKAFEEAYKKYLADYEAYVDAYYSIYAHPHAAHPAYAGHVIPGFQALPARLPYFQTPPAGYPDFPYVFGYPVILNGAGIIV